jgi:hypothetical protein
MLLAQPPSEQPWTSEQQPYASERQPGLSLSDLDEAVLIHILACVPDPHALACTCRALHDASATGLCRQLWFARWWPDHPVARERPLVLAALSWRGARRAPEAPSNGSSSTAALVQLLRGTLRLLGGSCGHLPPSAQQQLQLQTSLSPDARLQLLQQLTPWAEHLLLPAAAGSGHTELLRQLLADGAAASAAARAAGVAQGRVGRSRQRCWLQRRLPAELGLQACQHDVLQSAILAAARGGARGCLALLVQQLLASLRQPLVKLDLLLASAEAAAAAGHLACLQLIWGVLGAACTPHQHGGCDSCAEPEELAGRGWHEVLARFARELGPALQEVQPPSRLAWLASRGSAFLLVAASASGSCAVLDTVLQQLQPRAVKQQLPAALAAAGQRGHLAVLQQLLALPDMSARPLQVGWMWAWLGGKGGRHAQCFCFSACNCSHMASLRCPAHAASAACCAGRGIGWLAGSNAVSAAGTRSLSTPPGAAAAAGQAAGGLLAAAAPTEAGSSGGHRRILGRAGGALQY